MKSSDENIILVKSKAFALRIVKLFKFLCEEKKEYVLSKQILRSGTSIGANVKEASLAQSKADFAAKLSIAYIDDGAFNSIYADCQEIIKIITSILITVRNK